MKVRHVVSAAVVFFFIFVPVVLFAEEGTHARSVEDVLKAIRTEQHVTQNRDIDADKVSDNLLEELGDAVMSLQFPDERRHEWMDNMMGGEGSPSLRAAHIRMGYNYLAGGSRRGGGMYGPGMMGAGWDMPMMGGPGYGWGMGSFMAGPWGVVLIVGIIAVIGAVVVFVISRSRQTAAPSDALALLKMRLAKGEITVEEYEKLKSALHQ